MGVLRFKDGGFDEMVGVFCFLDRCFKLNFLGNFNDYNYCRMIEPFGQVSD